MQPIARHGRQRTPSAVGLIARAVLVSFGVMTVSAGLVLTVAVSSVVAPLADNAVDLAGTPPPPPPFLGAVEGGFNLLVVGTDNDRDQGEAFGHRDATLNDVTIVVHVADDHRSAVVASLPRDLVIPHPECVDPETGDEYDAMSASPLNQAWQRGGLACVATTVEELTGLDISYALATSFNGVIAMSDAVGGVEVCLEEPMSDADSGLDLPAGVSVVQGRTALAFLRNRHAVGDGSDLSRISSQQQYLSSLLRRIRAESTLSDPTRLYALARAVSDNTIPSRSLGGVDSLISLALALKDVDLSRVAFVQYPVVAWSEDPNKVVPDEERAQDLIAAMTTGGDIAVAPNPGAAALDQAPLGGTLEAPGTDAGASPAPETEPGTGDDPDDAEPPSAFTGQTAAESTCAVAS